MAEQVIDVTSPNITVSVDNATTTVTYEVSDVPGPQGPAGPAGPQGEPGPAGPAGADGAPGLPGADGLPGPKGDTGATGPAGADGAQGIQGIQGPAGADGAPGAAGEVGPIGPMGPAGPAGADGAAGAKGDTGDTGPMGPPGPTAVSTDPGNQATLGTDSLIFVAASGGSTDPEVVRDTIATALVAGANVTITPDDAGDTITIAATGGGGGGAFLGAWSAAGTYSPGDTVSYGYGLYMLIADGAGTLEPGAASPHAWVKVGDIGADPSAFTPASLGAKLAVWCDASDTATITHTGGAVSQWDDKSGNARHMTGAATTGSVTVSGLNALRQTGTQDLSGNLPSGSSVAFFVVRTIDSADATGIILPFTMFDYRGAYDGTATATSGGITGGGDRINGTDFTGTRSDLQALVATGNAFVWESAGFTSPGSWGTNYDGGGFDTPGNLCEVVVLTGATIEDRNAVTDYLMSKWGLA